MLKWKGLIFKTVLLTAVCGYSQTGGTGPEKIRGHVFQVADDRGVPAILMDGVPLRKRMFWGDGNKGGGCWLSSEWKRVEFTFRSPESTHGTIHMRFGEKSGNVWIDCVEIQELDTNRMVREARFTGTEEELKRDWTYWSTQCTTAPFPLSFHNGTLHIDMKDENLLKGFHVLFKNLELTEGHLYRVRFRVRADGIRFFSPGVYSEGAHPRYLGGLPPLITDQVRLAAAAGVNIVSFTVNGIWVEPGRKPVYAEIDRTCRRILEANPNALLFPRVRMNPPPWWAKRHPGEMTRFDDGRTGSLPSIASELYRKEAAQALRLLIRYCEKHFGDHMVGYQPEGGNTGEWFYPDTWERHLNGYDSATCSAFRKWLCRKYGSDHALQQSWRCDRITLDSAEVPTPADRRGDRVNCLREPANSRHVLDFADFQNENMADIVIGLGEVIRAETGKKRLSSTFYGYTFEFANVNQGPSISGHYALRRVLNSPAIDLLCSPISYRDRQLGGGTSAMMPTESVLLAGKLSLREDDTSTHIAYTAGNRKPGWNNGAKTMQESRLLLRRNLMAEACRNLCSWWMDLEGAGWFDSPELWKEMEAMKRVEEMMLRNPIPFRPEIAAVVDEKSMRCILSTDPVQATTNPLINDGRADLNRLGAPYGQYLLDDVIAGKSDAKLNVFLAAFALNRAERTALRKLSERCAAIWCWAPGYIDLESGFFSVEAVRELTGFEVEKVENGTPEVRATVGGLKIGLPPVFGKKQTVSPLLSPVPRPGDTVLAEYPDGRPAIVLHRGRVPVLFCGTTTLPPALYRYMAKLAGVHLYTRKDATVYANGPYVGVCAAEDGPLELDVGSSGPIRTEPESSFRGNGPVLKLNLKKGETLLFRRDIKSLAREERK